MYPTYAELEMRLQNTEAHNRVLLKNIEDLRQQLVQVANQRDEAIELTKSFRDLAITFRQE